MAPVPSNHAHLRPRDDYKKRRNFGLGEFATGLFDDCGAQRDNRDDLYKRTDPAQSDPTLCLLALTLCQIPHFFETERPRDEICERPGAPHKMRD